MKCLFHSARDRRNPLARRVRGFTLVELALAICMGLMIAAIAMSLINNQLTFLAMYRRQNFLIEEAPVINRMLSKMISQAERYRLHATRSDALTGTGATHAASPVVLLQYRQPDGKMRSTLMSFEEIDGRSALAYYILNEAGEAPATPDFVITRRAANISFRVEEGILKVTLTGPAGEEIVYSGTSQS